MVRGIGYDEAVSERPDDPSMPENRSAERVKIDAFVKVSGADREFVFRTRDLSKTGVFLYTKVAHLYPFKVGSTLTLELYDYDKFLSCKCVVARVVEPGSAESDHYPTGFGVRIVDISDEDREHLVSMLARAQRSGEDLY
jgi:hypothetical protein